MVVNITVEYQNVIYYVYNIYYIILIYYILLLVMYYFLSNFVVYRYVKGKHRPINIHTLLLLLLLYSIAKSYV